MLFPARGGRKGPGAPPDDWQQFGSLHRIYAAPVHVSLSAGKGKRNLEVWPREGSGNARPPCGCRPARAPGDCASHAAVRALGGGAAVGRELCVWVSGAWARAVAGTQREGGCQGAQARAAGRAGALVSSGSPARGGRLTPPPARPGSGGSSCRAPTAGRGPGRGPRRRRRPGRRGRRRASGNS